MSKLIFNHKSIHEFFAAMDIENTGFVTFQRFIQNFSQLRSGTED
jgi:hypothetical protein